ncbi:Molybdenum import ATP-binding protein ModC [Candidatus Terasakiella magnetica]|uniref:Molybdenum import ATP-binding protein ModC n=1 Tax=Candidatus Terasakiella magnetica TaxID=1867952 RepID=A0A1C3RHT1_9PROT|nr:molybdenum ABC transporter ATP-binding protein [Candidatus Terasakiella magnetica]SCA56836.1 Molybdenum import ATP-binding protein ModC [Candidatus Terasakiella magnetica]
MNDIQVRLCGKLEEFHLDVDFTIPSKGVTALFGQSGCGKTTVLRCLAGLHHMKDGELQVFGQVWQDQTQFIPAHKRAIGYVFQDANLFDHLSVKGNLLFGRKRVKQSDGLDFDEVVELLGLKDLLNRNPSTLSGGERQRVAIGRALLNAPKMLLMDEPLSALDRFSKDEIIPYLEKLNDVLDIPVIFISHDTDEVERLADHLVLMEKGCVRASGPLLDMLADPTLFIAKSAKTASVIEATIEGFDEEDQLSQLDLNGASLLVPGRVGDVGEKRRVRIAATDVSLALEEPSKTTILNVLQAKICDIHAIDEARINIVLCLGEGSKGRLIARITKRSLNSFGFEVGQSVYAQVKGVSMVERRRAG